MSTTENPRSRFQEEVTRRAASDPAFRQQLVSDPSGAMQSAFGVRIPGNVRVQVLEETADQVYVVLPAQGGGSGSDGELKSAAADSSTWGPSCSSC